MKSLSLLLVLSMIGCASSETTATDSAALDTSSEQVFKGVAWDLDPVLLERWGGDQPTELFVEVDPQSGTLNATLVHGLLPEFYETSITQTTVDACGAVHYEGASEVHPDWPEHSWKLAFVDGRASTCADRTVTAVLDSIHHDGRATHSVLDLEPKS